jgi:hypothetical protein
MTAHSIAGEWRGHYQYHQSPDLGSGFSAFFSEISGRIEGTIVDDFSPGKASLTGSFSFPSVQFTKVYLKAGQVEHIDIQANKTTYTIETFGDPVEYEGSMSEDGKSMSGTWVINSKNALSTGSWTAYRLEEEENKEVKEKASRVKERQLDEQLL